MAGYERANSASRGRRPLTSIPGRAAAATLRPFTQAAIPEFERLMEAALESDELQRAGRLALESEGARQLISTFFDSGLFDHLVDELLASKGLWRLVDEIAASPAVTAAITQQGLGFTEQVGDVVRTRSRHADDRLERAAHHLWPGRDRKAQGGDGRIPQEPS